MGGLRQPGRVGRLRAPTLLFGSPLRGRVAVLPATNVARRLIADDTHSTAATSAPPPPLPPPSLAPFGRRTPPHGAMVSAARPAAAGAMAVLPPAGAAAAGAPAATLPPIDVPAAQRHMEGHDHATRAAVLGVMAASPTFRLYPGESKEVERARTAARWAELADAGLFVDTIAAADAAAGRAKLDAIHETASLLDYSLCIGMSVHFSLFGGSIAALGTSAQAAAWLPGVEALTMRGCFALTELGHGSNARGVETEARFDAATDAFVLHTPTDAAQKYWIGGAATTARWAVAFAQLYMPGEATTRGVHAFVVRIREDDGTPVPGILLADCGYKVGLNGVDNGRIWFSHAPVPRGHLLARYARVDAAGVYTCDAPSPDALFGVTMSALSGGRIGIAASGVGQARVALAIALCYAIRRRAFAPTPTAPEVLLLDYPVHRRRLLPRLASTVVHQTALNDLKARWGRALSAKDGHVASCGFKSLMTWHALETMQVAREACGGQGYKSENRIGVSRYVAVHGVGGKTWGASCLQPAAGFPLSSRGRRGVSNGLCSCSIIVSATVCIMDAQLLILSAFALPSFRSGGIFSFVYVLLRGRRAALDISATFEGDNTVLLQQVCLGGGDEGLRADEYAGGVGRGEGGGIRYPVECAGGYVHGGSVVGRGACWTEQGTAALATAVHSHSPAVSVLVKGRPVMEACTTPWWCRVLVWLVLPPSSHRLQSRASPAMPRGSRLVAAGQVLLST